MQRGLALFWFLLLPFYAFGESKKLRIAYVDISKVIQEAEAAKEARRQLEKEIAQRREYLNKLNKELIRMQDELLRKRQFMTDEQFMKKRRELEKKQEEFLRLVRESEMQIQMLDSQLARQVLEDIRQIVEKIAKSEGYDLVVDKSLLLFAPDAEDITYRVIDEYNRVWRKKKKGAK